MNSNTPLSGFDKEELDNIVVIDKDYKWETTLENDTFFPIDKPVVIDRKKHRQATFHITEKPALCVEPGENTSSMETVPAIYRRG